MRKMWFQENTTTSIKHYDIKIFDITIQLFWNPSYSMPETRLMHMLDSDYGTMEVQKTWQAQENLDLVILMDNKKEYNLYISKTIICIPGLFNSAFSCILCENGRMKGSFWERQEEKASQDTSPFMCYLFFSNLVYKLKLEKYWTNLPILLP